MQAMQKLIKFVSRTKSNWLVPAVVIIILFVLINYFLANQGVIPFEYKIFSK